MAEDLVHENAQVWQQQGDRVERLGFCPKIIDYALFLIIRLDRIAAQFLDAKASHHRKQIGHRSMAIIAFMSGDSSLSYGCFLHCVFDWSEHTIEVEKRAVSYLIT